MNKIDMIFSFILGAAAGSVVTWEVVKYKFDFGPYEDIIEECSSENSELTSVEGIEGVKKNAKNIIIFLLFFQIPVSVPVLLPYW